MREQSPRPQTAHHDFAQSANIFELLGERYQAALSHLALGRLSAAAGSTSAAERYLEQAASVFTLLGAQRDLAEVDAVRAAPEHHPGRGRSPPRHRMPTKASSAGWWTRRSSRNCSRAKRRPRCSRSPTRTAVVVFTESAGGDVRVVAAAGCDGSRGHEPGARRTAEALGACRPSAARRVARPRSGRGTTLRRLADEPLARRGRGRLRMFTAISRQGFELCGARERPRQAVDQHNERPLEPLLPGFICAGPAMNRLADQIQRLQGHNLTVLITGESGTGKDLVARAIHVGSPRSAAMFLPYNCTTTTRELADSQLFGHRRGSFTGAVTDQQGLIRSAAGGTLFLDEIGDLPLDIQPKLLRFLEQGEIMPVGETRPQAVDVRVLAATNADLEQRVGEGKFREDLYYRLSVIRIHVPPLRERREEMPHLSTFFLRDACERLGKPDVHLSSATLDLFARYWWPGNVRQLRNEIQRAVAMSPPGGTIEPEHLSADLAAPERAQANQPALRRSLRRRHAARQSGGGGRNRRARPDRGHARRTRGNISETARVLGLTRRGLYLKMRRLGLEGADCGYLVTRYTGHVNTKYPICDRCRFQCSQRLTPFISIELHCTISALH